MRYRLLFFVITTLALPALELDELRQKAKQKTDTVRSESQKKVERILRRFAEFKADLEKRKPGLDIVLPIDTKNAGKLRLVDHNELTGIPEIPRVFAIVTRDYQLKTWHAEKEVENLERVRAGEKVEVIMVVNPRNSPFAWALVRTAAENEGYIPQAYLSNAPEQDTKSSTKKETKYVITPAGLRMRSEPSLAGDFIKLVPLDAELEVIGYSEQRDTIDGITDYWAEANYDGTTGWLFNGYLRPVSQKAAAKPPSTNAAFMMPVDGRVSSQFGPRIDPVTKKSGDFHRGIDIMAPIGEPIKAAKPGEVFENSTNKWWGHYIIIKHADDLYTYYCHQSRTAARKGQQVAAGQLIGYVGKTGKATGPHLHFEVRVGKDPKDPLQYLR